MNYGPLVSGIRSTFKTGRSRDIEWRVQQLKSFLRLLEENEQLFIDAVYRDLKKTKFEAIIAETAFLKNDVTCALREVKEWAKV